MIRRTMVAALSLAALVAAHGASAGERERLPAPGDFVHVEELPEVLERVLPGYPPVARKAGVEGAVMVRALVGRDGRVRGIRIQKSVPMLDRAAIECVRRWRFKPAEANGEPIAVWVAVPVRFSLHGEGGPSSVAPPAGPRPYGSRLAPEIDRERPRRLPVSGLLEHPVWPPERGLAPGPGFEHPIWPPEWSKADSLVRLLGRPSAGPGSGRR